MLSISNSLETARSSFIAFVAPLLSKVVERVSKNIREVREKHVEATIQLDKKQLEIHQFNQQLERIQTLFSQKI
ncbi:MAG: hypothetical protein JSS61_01405 [Verrucomicrobia bacterium]|nr:hypothetical protein [Verrucomicrobiota bacterium]